MRASRNLQLYPIFFLLFSTFAAAWPWPRWLPELDSLVVRADSSTASSAAATTAATDSASPSETGSTTTGSQTDSQTDSQSGSSTAAGSNTGGTSTTFSNSGSITSSATTSKTTHTSYNVVDPAGGVSMMTPAVSDGAQYYKIGDFVTFAWNYTSLSATPTAINVLATCTANKQLYTLAMNQTIANNTNAVTWDTGSYQATAVSDPLLTQTYTLIIYDADSSISAVAEAGYLAAFDSFTFGMYSPQPYTPLGEFQCATCSGALSDMERRALGLMLGMSILTVLSFTWFVGGTGVIW